LNTFRAELGSRWRRQPQRYRESPAWRFETKKTLTLPCEVGEVSDGCHTFNELYEHRCSLFLLLMHLKSQLSWRSKKHSDGTSIDGWFIAGMDLPNWPVTYHLPVRMWPLAGAAGIPTLECTPKWDGHTSADVAKRLENYLRWLAGLELTR
jgi:hypothetical protein